MKSSKRVLVSFAVLLTAGLLGCGKVQEKSKTGLKDANGASTQSSVENICRKTANLCHAEVGSSPNYFKFILSKNDLPMNFIVYRNSDFYQPFEFLSCEESSGLTFCSMQYSSETIVMPVQGHSDLFSVTVNYDTISGSLGSIQMFPRN